MFFVNQNRTKEDTVFNKILHAQTQWKLLDTQIVFEMNLTFKVFKHIPTWV